MADQLDLAGLCTGDGPCSPAPTGTGNNWVTKAGGLPLYIRAIVNAMKRSGMPEARAVVIAIGRVKAEAAGGGNVTAATRARAAKAVAEWEALKGRSHSHTATPVASVDLAMPSLRARTGKFATSNNARRAAMTPSSMTEANIRKALANLSKVPAPMRAATKARLMAKAKAMKIDLSTTFPGTSKFPVNTQAQFEAACRLYGNSTLPKDKVKAWLIGVGQRNGWPLPAAWK